ncbi:MAG: glycosyltransferase [Chitinophagaceae bacterium]|nr:MAG: glycosyltransferase [Chitinophagaceae bacterium]
MIKLIDCSFNYRPEISLPEVAIESHAPAYGYAQFLRTMLSLEILEHINYDGEVVSDKVHYRFFKSNKHFTHIPFKTLLYIRKAKADVIIVQGLIFPLQVIALRFVVGRKCAIIAQHHGLMPWRGLKKILQKLADGYIRGYLFTSLDNAKPWIDQKVISGYHKCYEALEASTFFKQQDRQKSRLRLGINGHYNFLWVGRLQVNKDPVTMLVAFEDYLNKNQDAKLYMIYQDETLLQELKMIMETNQILRQSVFLLGKIPHEELPYWYSAADFYVSCSHREGSGFALLEAMSCGCIPVVTNIPSFRKITANGKYGFLFEPGNIPELLKILNSLYLIDRTELSRGMLEYFEEELSFSSIAERLYFIFSSLMAK